MIVGDAGAFIDTFRLMFDLLEKTSIYRVVSGLWRRRFRSLSTNRFLQFAPPGHFYSPIPDERFVQRYRAHLFDGRVSHVPGINISAEKQCALVEQFAGFYNEIPFPSKPSNTSRYYFDNRYFSYGDAITLYSMLRWLQPTNVVEVGSGFSSALMLDTHERYLSRSVRFTFIEPHPHRLRALLNPQDQLSHELIVDNVQDVPLDRFRSLKANDILFIDSSHVVKIGSDVVHLLSSVLPILNAGVIIHFHDIFWPFEYPESWINDGRAWNEAYALKAFLQFNSTFEILFFNSYLGTHHSDVLRRHLPLFLENTGGSIWLKKVT